MADMGPPNEVIISLSEITPQHRLDAVEKAIADLKAAGVVFKLIATDPYLRPDLRHLSQVSASQELSPLESYRLHDCLQTTENELVRVVRPRVHLARYAQDDQRYTRVLKSQVMNRVMVSMYDRAHTPYRNEIIPAIATKLVKSADDTHPLYGVEVSTLIDVHDGMRAGNLKMHTIGEKGTAFLGDFVTALMIDVQANQNEP